ncbi:MAG: flagellar M-ring protein FliF [Gammaproteobacteria bacterium]|uniref:flagellar basal-body MS-ring/collar protein FliF n=1 Tax=Rhodoferax sp. TaxID=50421 RepID=UPI00179365BB|nr:flagellar basal-body MS-ring/collar protein FliF [Rhodoferax sp.]MBU3900462.1 flagellar M-ring protein FliF [Gammaproteobacteria bacterium]MBA3059929.1 flagellar basal body M-ring protein FliF [Rhodoferax sp.]MBU3997134.1 flagellar M-ring protein FliF [Gammaproteobacteria bacterium]MBU4079907.1 flagellar M-ring protein FliF [Gammaproteobacteria bacterium]MBU4112922.1 flagellar M-ring protein FliF [Gammaproteobacteria bacterium]
MSAAPAIPINPTLSQRFSGLDQAQRLRMALGLAVFIAIGIIGLVMGRQAEWRVLYANLADKDGGAIVAQLSTMNIPYKHADGGGAILVPADKVYDTRLKLASQGLPKGSVAGFETMDANRFGMTQFQERLAYQRGLEGELTRSIQALSSVQSARVHLALPNQNGFFREQQKPSASVLVSLNAGRTLDRAQLAGIVHLVSSSVPEMNATAVSVLDDSGKLLSTPAEGAEGTAGADAQQLQYVQQLEQLYSRRILDILEPVVGRGNARAQVTAELDFSQTESTSESHKPNQLPDSTAIRSQQVSESSNSGLSGPPSGVPGATSNQPPGPSSAPINGAPQTLTAVGGAAGAGGRRESIINYEVDKTIKVVRGGTGIVKRISAAVVVNHQSLTDAKGKTTTTPLTEQQIEQMTALVRETVGFNKERGDSVNLMNAPFATEKMVVVDLPFWKQAEVQDLARSFAWPLGTLLFGALVLLGVIRPAIKTLAQSQPRVLTQARQLDAIESETPDRPQLAAPSRSNVPAVATSGELALDDARKLTRDNPAAVANIVKTWINGEAPA